MKKFIKDLKHSGKEKLSKKLGDSPINYWSDLFVVAMVIISMEPAGGRCLVSYYLKVLK